jgi:hypothetical protein
VNEHDAIEEFAWQLEVALREIDRHRARLESP